MATTRLIRVPPPARAHQTAGTARSEPGGIGRRGTRRRGTFLRIAGVLEVERRGDVDAAADRPVDRATVGMEAVDALGGWALLGPQAQPVADVDPADHQDVAVLLDLSGRLR